MYSAITEALLPTFNTSIYCTCLTYAMLNLEFRIQRTDLQPVFQHSLTRVGSKEKSRTSILLPTRHICSFEIQ